MIHTQLGDNSASIPGILAITNPGASRVDSSDEIVMFVRTATLTSAAAATAVSVVRDWEVGAGRKCYVTDVYTKVNGATNWATTANIKVQDTNSSAVDFLTITVNAASTNGNVFAAKGNAQWAVEAAWCAMSGGTAAKGLQVKADANGTGSDMLVTVVGFIK